MKCLKDFWPELVQFSVAAVLFVCAPAPAPAEPTAAERDSISVIDALNVASGLNQLTIYETVDKEGKPSKGFYEFSADTRILIALNMEIGRRVQSSFERVTTDIRAKFSAGAASVPPEQMAAFNKELVAVGDSPSRVAFHHIKLRDLCMKVEGACKVANPIPASVLSLILPIVDRGDDAKK